MDKVLIADSDSAVLNQIQKGFRDLHHFELLTARDGKTALSLLHKNKIAVFVTAVHLPNIPGIELIAFITRKRPETPCIVMVEPDTPKPRFQNRTSHEDVLYYLQKPFAFGKLASAIFVGQSLKDEGLSRRGITLRNFLPLIEICGKTCRLDVTGDGNKQGYLYFDRGVLLNAQCENLAGEAAAREMARWERVHLFLSELPKEQNKKIIKNELMEIAGALWARSAPRAPERAEAACPGQQPPGPQGQNGLQAALRRHAGMLHAVNGYKGLAIITPEGKVLATDAKEEAPDFSAFAASFSKILSFCQQTAHQQGFANCSGITLHTNSGRVLLMAADAIKEGNYRFLLLMDTNSNSYFMHVQLTKIIPAILQAK
ncbi:MAG: response regulator [Desulfosalsimonadaceae bacterium]